MSLLTDFRNVMIKNVYSAYLIATSDFHNSEYIPAYFKTREFLTGFTGSAGTLLITEDNAYLWVDGRYFIQAEKQVDTKEITIMKMGQPNVPTLTEFISKNLIENSILGFDGRTINAALINDIKKATNDSIAFEHNNDLINLVWNDRPPLPYSLLYKLDDYYTGETYQEKVNKIRLAMANEGCSTHVLASLEDQAWLYNLRANDIEHTPDFLSFTVITENQTLLFIDENKISPEVKDYLDEQNIIIKPYLGIFEYAKELKDNNILLNSKSVNYSLYTILAKNNTIVDKQNPSLYLKSIKNQTEIKNTKKAHIKDGIAFTKFMYYAKTKYAEGYSLDEISLSNKIQELRCQQRGFIDISFNTICAFKDHGAMMHYSATPESNYKISENGLLLIDSGGHYLNGTTDITRTIVMGKASDKMKVHYTTVVKSIIRLSKAVFLSGCTGQNLDILARGPIWDLGIDYKCGTGHGVGHLLSVHEAPNGFRWQIVPERNDSHKLEPGMITTNEPGIYLEGSYGIRIENELLCVEKEQNEFGNFLAFETITYAPIDLDAIKPSLLSKDEREWLNEYHKVVYDKISPSLTDEEKAWLETYTRSI